MKLKTLKDFENEAGSWQGLEVMEEIKAEAIKCIKFFRSGKAIKGVNDIDSYIKWANNITEEDLK